MIKLRISKDKKLDLKIIFKKLYALGSRNILIEGGNELTTYLVKKRLFNKFYLFKSKKILSKMVEYKEFTALKNLKQNYKKKLNLKSDYEKLFDALSGQEKVVASLITEGALDIDIAKHLNVVKQSIQTYKSRIREKLQKTFDLAEPIDNKKLVVKLVNLKEEGKSF